MKKKCLIIFLVLLVFSNVYAVNPAYLKTKIKNSKLGNAALASLGNIELHK